MSSTLNIQSFKSFKRLLGFLFFLGIFFLATDAKAQKFPDLQASPTDIALAKKSRKEKPTIKVIYSRPQKKGREVFGKLVKYEKVWRTGADEATEIQFYKDYTFGNNTIKAGRYSLFTIPGEREWTIILNSDLDSWGAFSYDENKDVARINVSSQTSKNEIEAFSIAFEANEQGYNMFLGWDNVIVSVPFMESK